jgi:predicted nucleic acid-binding protein
MKEVKIAFLDTDIIANWLLKEIETATNKNLWKAPFEIISRIEAKEIKGCVSLTSLLELRFLLRRKKEYPAQEVNVDVAKLTGLFEVVIPGEIELLRTNKLQEEYPLDPFDAILLSLVLTLPNAILISRDTKFLKGASRLIETATPEEFLSKL